MSSTTGRPVWPPRAPEYRPSQAAAPAPTEHPGLVIHSLETGKETHLQPPGTVRPAYGANNKTFTADAAAAARERLRAKLNQLNAGFDPEIMLDGLTLAGFHIEAGARSFADYAKAMLSDLGDQVRPFLGHF
jgi:hypothetical protein